MAKKHKKKQKKFLKLWDVDSKNIEILESGKIKFKKDEKIDISSFAEDSVKDARISRLEGIPSKEEITIDGSATYRLNASANCSSISRIVDLVGAIDTNEIQTIVVPVTKKKALSLEENDTIRWLAGSSTFLSVYSKLKKNWEALNDDDSSVFTNVLFIPKIYLFLEKKGKLRKTPITINLLIVALPTQNKAKSGLDDTDEYEYTSRIISDTVDAVIRCGCKSIIVDPYAMKALQEDVHYTARYWYGKIETQRVIENVRSITFSIDNDNLYVIFCKNKQSV